MSIAEEVSLSDPLNVFALFYVIIRASFYNFFYSFQQLLKCSKYLCFNVLSCFQEFYIATFCKFFNFCVQLFTAIFIKYCAKGKSENKKMLQNYFSLVLFSLIA